MAAEQETSFDFTYVSPNTGHAAGGHYGLKLGEYIYHYQFFANGEFLLVRDNWQKFILIYAELSNRSIHVAKVPVNETSFEKVEQQLAQTLIGQNLDLQQRKRLSATQHLLEHLKSGGEQLSVPAVGLFACRGEAVVGGELSLLKQAIVADLGEGILSRELRKIQEKINLHEREPITARWGEELQNMLQKRAALESIASSLAVDENAVIPPLPKELPFGEETRIALQRYQMAIYQTILRLVTSSRPGDGAALLLQLARYQVLTVSLKRGRVHTLDPFPADVQTITLSEQILGSDALQNLYRVQLLDQQNLLEQLVTSNHPELVMNRLEEVRGRMSELVKVFQGERQIRYSREKMVPEISGMVNYRPQAEYSPEDLERAERSISHKLELTNRLIAASYRYNLLSRNCVTEMNRQVNETFSSRHESEQQLGGWISPGEQFSFSPFMFHTLVANNYHLKAKEEIPSRRLKLLEGQQIDSLLAWLRESNAMTSTVYDRRQRDTAFLMFTDSNWALRPLFGLINACYGTLYALTGVATLPFDKGERIEQGALGIFYSLPELFYLNIRKGTYLAPDYSFLEESP